MGKLSNVAKTTIANALDFILSQLSILLNDSYIGMIHTCSLHVLLFDFQFFHQPALSALTSNKLNEDEDFDEIEDEDPLVPFQVQAVKTPLVYEAFPQKGKRFENIFIE